MSDSKEVVKKYHKDFYERSKLFEKGTWIEKPEDKLLYLVRKNFSSKENVNILDIGSGVGRNAIPMANVIGEKGGTVTCVDFLDTAVDKLKENAKQYKVYNYIKAETVDFEDYIIKPNYFDLIIAYSSLEHGVKNKESFLKIIDSMKKGTKKGGVNFLGITTDLEELDEKTLKKLPKDIGLDVSYEEAEKILKEAYKDWNIRIEENYLYEERYVKNEKMIIWKSNFLTFIAQK